MLSKKPNWLTEEVSNLIEQVWHVKLSLSQVARILKKTESALFKTLSA
jgi:transposase